MRKKTWWMTLFLLVTFCFSNLYFVLANPSSLLFSEGFEDEKATLLTHWTETNGFLRLSNNKIHSGTQSLMTQGTGSLVLDQTIGRGVYEIWYYDDVANTATATTLLQLGNSEDDKTFQWGIKKASYNGKLFYKNFNNETGGIADRTPGWHQLVADFVTKDNMVDFYLDGVLVKGSVTTRKANAVLGNFMFLSGWDSGGYTFYWDDFRVWNTLGDVPLHRSAMLQTLVFESGKEVEHATQVRLNDGSISLTFQQEMKPLSSDSFGLYQKPLSSDSDQDYQEAGTVSVSTKTNKEALLTLPPLLANTQYKLVFQGVETLEGKTMAQDFVTFSTASRIDAEPVEVTSLLFADKTPVDGANNCALLPQTLSLGLTGNALPATVISGISLRKQGSTQAQPLLVTGAVDSYQVALPALEFDTTYELVLSASIANAQTTWEQDRVFPFSTKPLLQSIGFENGVSLPAQEVVTSYGNLVLSFANMMNVSTLSAQTLRILQNGVPLMTQVGEQSAATYVLDLSNTPLLPNTTYTVEIGTGVKTLLNESPLQPKTYSFTTGKNLAQQSPVVEEGFEDGLSFWSSGTVTDHAYQGKKALVVNQGPKTLQYLGEVPKNGVFEAYFYDDGSSEASCLLSLQGVNAKGEGTEIFWGAKAGIQNYTYRVDGTGDRSSGMPRSKGWHRMMIDASIPGQAVLYVDNQKMYDGGCALTQVKQFGITNPWTHAPFSFGVDEVRIWNTMDETVMNALMVTPPVITGQQQQALLSIKPGDSVNITSKIDNQTPAQKTAVMLIGFYQNNQLVEFVKSDSLVLAPGQSEMITVPISVPVQQDLEVKAFLWEDSMRPLSLTIKPAETPLKVAFIGGSITNGTGASAAGKNYVSLVGEFFKQQYDPQAEIIRAAIGGTTSELGRSRLCGEVSRHLPDIVFVEFAVNDRQRNHDEIKASMELLVQQLLALPKIPKIVFVYTTTWQFEAVAQVHQEVADYYGIPSIDLQAYLQTLGYTAGASMLSIMPDGVHPNDAGYQIYADRIKKLLQDSPQDYLRQPNVRPTAFQK